LKALLSARAWWFKAGILLLLVVLSASVAVRIGAQESDGVRLDQNYPNPFSEVTVIKYYVPSSGQVKLTVQNMLGSELAELENTKRDKGEYSVRFEGSNYPSGQYSYTLKYKPDDNSAQTKLTKKMYLVR
jgi:hypothetical protein